MFDSRRRQSSFARVECFRLRFTTAKSTTAAAAESANISGSTTTCISTTDFAGVARAHPRQSERAHCLACAQLLRSIAWNVSTTVKRSTVCCSITRLRKLWLSGHLSHLAGSTTTTIVAISITRSESDVCSASTRFYIINISTARLASSTASFSIGAVALGIHVSSYD